MIQPFARASRIAFASISRLAFDISGASFRVLTMFPLLKCLQYSTQETEMKLSELVDTNRIKELARQRERIRASLETLHETGVSEAVNTDTGRSYTIPEDLRPVIVRMLSEHLTKKGQKLDDELLIHGVVIDVPLIAPQDLPPLDDPSDAGVKCYLP